jgi:hypothetical protein
MADRQELGHPRFVLVEQLSDGVPLTIRLEFRL